MALLANKHQNIKLFNINDLRGGINLYSQTDKLAENEAVILENFEFSPNTDQLVTRGGLSAPLFTFQYDIKSVFYDYEMHSYLVFLNNKNIYKYTLNGNPELLGILLGDNRPVCCKFGGKVIIASGDKLQSYDYISLTTIENSPYCDDVFERFGRIAITKAGTDNIMYSAIGDPTSWTDDPNDDSSAKFIEIGYKDDGNIIGVFPLSTDIIVFKDNGKIYQLAGEYPNWSVFNIGNNADFVSRFASVHVGNELVFISKYGLKTLSTSMEYGNFAVKNMGDKINSDLINNIYNPVIWSLPRKKQIILNPNCGNVLYVYHYLFNAFTTVKFQQPITDIAESSTEVIVAIGNSLYFWSQDYATDNGTAITAKIRSRTLKSPGDLVVKRVMASIESATVGSATISIDVINLKFDWTPSRQVYENRIQLRGKEFVVNFETTSKMYFNYVYLEVVNI